MGREVVAKQTDGMPGGRNGGSPHEAGANRQPGLSVGSIIIRTDGTASYGSSADSHVIHLPDAADVASVLRQSRGDLLAVGVAGANGLAHAVRKAAWRDSRIVPITAPDDLSDHTAIEQHVAGHFDNDGVPNLRLGPDNEVHPQELISLDDYRETDPQGYDKLVNFAEKFKGKRISFFSATPRGGGVALMRHALIRLYRELGVDAHWYVMTPDQEIFDITKGKFHNILQNEAEPGTVLTEHDKSVFNKWSEKNARGFIENGIFQNTDVAVFDDPQVTGLIPYFNAVKKPDAKSAYRSHIEIVEPLASTEGTSQNITWKFLYDGRISETDAFVSHPIRRFVPANVPFDKVVQMPPTTDLLDGLNIEQTDAEVRIKLEKFNRILTDANHNQTPLDLNRPYDIQGARFDPSKNIHGVLQAYLIERLMMDAAGVPPEKIPQLVITGVASIDDPDGKRIYEKTMAQLQSAEYAPYANDVKVARLPHDDLLFGALLQGSKNVIQYSTREGYEIKATEARNKRKPTLVSNGGALPLQVEHGVSGYIVDAYKPEELAQHLFNLNTDDELYARISEGAGRNIDPKHFTVANAYKWLFIANELLSNGRVEKADPNDFAAVEDLAQMKYFSTRGRRRSLASAGK